MKKKIILLALILCVIVIASILSDPPIGVVTIDDTSDYYRFNKFVKSSIESEFSSTLPKVIPPDVRNAEYHYLYSCGLLGDPTFYVFLRVEYADKDSICEEKRHLEQLAPICSLPKDEEQYLIFAGNEESFNGYLDDKPHSGVFWHFNIVVINENERTITYSLARYQDSYSKLDQLTNTIKNTKIAINNAGLNLNAHCSGVSYFDIANISQILLSSSGSSAGYLFSSIVGKSYNAV